MVWGGTLSELKHKINHMEKVAAIILAAGKGKRMKAKGINKVVFPLGNKQMILHAVDLLNSLSIRPIVVVVGFAKESVMNVLGNCVIYAEQKKRLGTAHAVSCALKKLPINVEIVLVLNGDDSAFYKKETIEKLIEVQNKSGAVITFLTIELDNPIGLGRVVRDKSQKVLAIVEDKDASIDYKKIKEINPGCYMFTLDFLRKYIKTIKKSKITGEYYLTSLIDVAIKNNEKIETVRGGKLKWRGINTKEELEAAEKIFSQSN